MTDPDVSPSDAPQSDAPSGNAPSSDAPAQADTWTSRDLAIRMAELIDEKQGADTVILEVGPAFQVTDYFVITEGQNRRHLAAIAEHVAKELKRDGLHRMGGSAMNDADWVLLDFGAVVFHAFSNEARGYYDLENLWGDCERVEWQPATNSDADPDDTED